MIGRIERRAVAIAAVCAIAAYVWLNSRPGADPPIRADGFNYYLYAPSWLIYHDLSLDRLSNDWFGGAYPDFAGMIRWPGTDRWLNRFPIGVSVLLLPFATAADLLTRWSNFPRDGFSFYYQHAAAAAGIAYFLAGLALVRRTLRRQFTPAVSLATLTVITFGTDLFHYAVYDATFSHAFSFALVAALVELCDRWRTRPTRWHAPALGVLCALIVLVRHTNAVFLLLIPLWSGRITQLWNRRRELIAIAVVAAIGIAPQLAYYRWVTGSWIVNPYAATGLHFSLLSPHLFGVLLSTQRGLFFWSPALLLAVAGAFVTRAWARERLLAVAVVLLLHVWIVASWSEWQYGASYGQRPFIESFALIAILIAAFFTWVSERPRLVLVTGGFAALATLLSVVQMLQYWLHVWPTRDITWAQYRSLFLVFR